MFHLLRIAIMALLLTSSYLQATGDYIYAVISSTKMVDSSYVIQFGIEDNDSLVQLKTWPTGGMSSRFPAKSKIISDNSGKHLFIGNVDSDDISVLEVLDNGDLRSVEGSPFKTPYETPNFLKLHPSGKFLYVAYGDKFCWFDVAENGKLTINDSLLYATIDSIPYHFCPREMHISSDGSILYLIDMILGVRAYHIDSENGALTEFQDSPFVYNPLSRAYHLYPSKSGDSLFVIDTDEGTFAFSVNQDGSLEQISDKALVKNQELATVAAFSTDYKYMFYGRKGWIYSYINAGSPSMKAVDVSYFGNYGIYWVSQIINYPPENVIYSFSNDNVFQHSYDNFGKLEVIREPLIINAKEFYELNGAVLIRDVTTSIHNNSNDNTIFSFRLQQNYPNPFNPSTTINYQLPENSDVNLSIYNILGQKVVTLVSGKQTAGAHKVEWNASGLSSGVYFYHLKAGQQSKARKMILLQ